MIDLVVDQRDAVGVQQPRLDVGDPPATFVRSPSNRGPPRSSVRQPVPHRAPGTARPDRDRPTGPGGTLARRQPRPTRTSMSTQVGDLGAHTLGRQPPPQLGDEHVISRGVGNEDLAHQAAPQDSTSCQRANVTRATQVPVH
jgi:hypothetical protein